MIRLLHCLYLCLSVVLATPRRPPAPLFANAGSNHITVKVIADKNAELERSDDGETWQPVGQQTAVPPERKNVAMTVTADKLDPNTDYRFRVRAVGTDGNSPWSESSSTFTTLPSVSTAPRDLSVLSATPSSISLIWKAPPSQGGHDPVTSYDVQYRRHLLIDASFPSDHNSTAWVEAAPVSAIEVPPQREVQVVSTLVDDSSVVTDGTFWLKIHGLASPGSTPKASISGPIPHNASADEFEQALQKIEGIGKVRIFRYGREREHELDVNGCYTWRIEFNDRRRFPLLEVHSHSLQGSLNEHPIVVKRIQQAADAVYMTSISTVISHLQSYEYYDFRVRANNKYGYGIWSDVLPDVQTSLPAFPTDNLIFQPGDDVAAPLYLNPSITLLSHDMLTLSWEGIGSEVVSYEIELSVGRKGSGSEPLARCSEEYKAVEHVRNDDKSREFIVSTIEDLIPNTSYCARVIAISKRNSKRSDEIAFTTPTIPVNSWDVVHARGYPLKRVYRDHRRCKTPRVPSPRRGHSMAVVLRDVYLFGGFGDVCVCDAEMNSSCSTKKRFLNDLWKFDTTTSTFELLRDVSFSNEDDNDSWPSGREQHSAVAMNDRGSFLIIGGKADRTIYGDAWEISVGPTSMHVIEGKDAGIGDGVISHAVLSFENDKELCITSIQVKLSLQHPCTDQIGMLSLYGPKGHHVNLYSRASSQPSSNQCSHAQEVQITFADDADEMLQDILPSSGVIRPQVSLDAHFLGTMANGDWTLAIQDSLTDDTSGTLNSWSIDLTARPCIHVVSAEQMTTNTHERIVFDEDGVSTVDDCSSEEGCFTPRYAHATIGVGSDIFVVGGYAKHGLNDIWRFSVIDGIWSKLSKDFAVPSKRQYGGMFTLTPGGVIGLDGIDQPPTYYSPLTEKWSTLLVDVDLGMPLPRYLSSACYTDAGILQHGGDSSLSSFFYQDLWRLSLSHLLQVKMKHIAPHRDRMCALHLQSGSTTEGAWNASCGASTSNRTSALELGEQIGICRWEDIVLRAWCLGEYQTFYSPI